MKPYDGRTDPEQWLNVYETAIRATRGDEHVMANYLPVLLGQAATHWFGNHREGPIHTWGQLRQMMIDNFKAICRQPRTKYELDAIRDRPGEPLREYVRRFSDVWSTVADITEPEAVEKFIKGLTQPSNEKCKIELIRQDPKTMSDVLRIASRVDSHR